jgi:hypothetical protein
VPEPPNPRPTRAVQHPDGRNRAWLPLVALRDPAGRPTGRALPLSKTNAANVYSRTRLRRERRRRSNQGYRSHGPRDCGKAVTGGFWLLANESLSLSSISSDSDFAVPCASDAFTRPKRWLASLCCSRAALAREATCTHRAHTHFLGKIDMRLGISPLAHDQPSSVITEHVVVHLLRNTHVARSPDTGDAVPMRPYFTCRCWPLENMR